MAKKKNGNGGALAVVSKTEYALVSAAEEIADILKNNLGGEQIKATDLTMIKVPAGGGIAWEVPTLAGVDSVKEVKGVVIGQRSVRAYWQTSYDESPGMPPDCFSEDCYKGVGDPGGNCHECPMAVFGTADGGEGRGQACRQRKLLFILRENDLLPAIIVIPPTSLKAIKKKFLECASARVRIEHVEMGFGLQKAKSKNGITYSEVVPSVRRTLPDEMVEKVNAYRGIFNPAQTYDVGQHTDDVFGGDKE